jgi:hypothetical protein
LLVASLIVVGVVWVGAFLGRRLARRGGAAD